MKIYNVQSPKRPTNLSINSDLLAVAKRFDINLSATLERALLETVKFKQREQWKVKHGAAIEAYNKHVDEQGVFSDGQRGF